MSLSISALSQLSRNAENTITLASEIERLNSESIPEIQSRLPQKNTGLTPLLLSLVVLNGESFQDPNSLLKQAWDKVVSKIQKALNFKVESRHDLKIATDQLKSDDAKSKKARDMIAVYRIRERARNTVETRLNEILKVEETGFKALRERQKELCGDYFGDPQCLLDKKWQEYQRALTVSPSYAPSLLDAYNCLESERKINKILLQRINP